MIFNSIHLEEAGIKRLIKFSDQNNLIHSISNSKGKTTLLRLLLYSIGYSVPNTKHIKFEECKIETKITLDNGEPLLLTRTAKEYITVKRNGSETTYILPSQENELHKIIYNVGNADLMNNLLGTFYFDQEKGWTLLNRGVVIGSLRFNIEELIRGIANIDCSELIRLRETKKQDLLKYQQMFSVSKYQEILNRETRNLASESYNTFIDSNIRQLVIKQNMLKKELHRIDKVLNDNSRFKTFIAEIGLLVKTPNNKTIAVTEDNIVGLNDTINFLIAKKKIIASQYNQVNVEINKTKLAQKTEEKQLSFFYDMETIALIFDEKIASIPINGLAVQKQIEVIKNEVSDINSKIRDITRGASSVISSIFNNAKRYLIELGLDGATITNKYLFTSNLKELSGAILHKTVFAFRLAYLLEVEKHLKIKIPIILDSPSGKEVDHQNIQKMIEILNRDFSENQIIMASIFEYDLKNIKKINICNNLIE